MKYRLRRSASVEVIRGDCFHVLDTPDLSGRVQLVIADPPYGKILKDSWDVECYHNLGKLLERVLAPGATAYVWGGIGTPNNRPFFQWLGEVEEDCPRLKIWDLITWGKRRAYGVKDRYLFTREECVMLVKGDRPATFHVPLLDDKRGYPGYNVDYPAKSEYKRRTNVWTDITEIFKGKIHVAEKPSRLAEIMIRTSSSPGDLVVDPFAGSGSTGMAVKAVGSRRCLLIEKSDCTMHDGLL